MAAEDDIRTLVERGRARGLSDEQIRAVVERYRQRATAPAPQPPQAAPPQRLAGVGIQTVSDEDWSRMTPADRARGVLTAAGRGVASMLGMGEAGADAVEHPTSTLVTAAVGAAVPRVAAMVPTRAAAGQKFQQVMGAVGREPVDVARPGDAALRIQELSERGASMPKVVRDFLRRATDPTKGDPTYQEMRDFYSNISRLSADEAKRLNPVVRLELGKLRVALDRALAQTAAKGGQEQVYREAMRQYAIASRTRELAEKAVKYGAGAAGMGYLYSRLSDIADTIR